jgi:hypothetical protein
MVNENGMKGPTPEFTGAAVYRVKGDALQIAQLRCHY